jgi:hypothetical protein
MIRGLAEKLGLTSESLRGIAGELDARERAMDRARASRDTRVRPVVPTARQITRAQNRAATADARRGRRRAFVHGRQQQRSEQTLRTWARVYLEGAGNEQVRRNVTRAVHRQAEVYAKAHGEPFEASLKRVEGLLLNALPRRSR